ncbi:RNA binding protein [Geomicrobium sp. JCM 19037]|uniref:S1 domain-containing RNA-binding protein n=1 Tax=unclassified Geomicrobium TaxID=2628951 RepID=UPI00045F2AB0|nr:MULTISPECIES: S1 domain-containing RNA-binding protein [unclassified Geomicrobium]GAK04883.1 RNA binding protein [Geomicrobium sp. JCM 19037]GAK13908.1 RNA binding protein [Geomicrobium sp. JCM 19039]
MSIETGNKYQGKVTGVTKFGAFVDLPGGKTGLVHISEVADQYVKDINEFVKVGDEVTVKVLKVENDGKIGLSIRKATDRPKQEEKPRRNQPFKKREQTLSFEDKMNRFLKDSEENLATIRKKSDNRKGGGRR